jgi:D-3-phosphoglycerate dehydrogenase / 2-oxoglutarate reductase
LAEVYVTSAKKKLVLVAGAAVVDGDALYNALTNRKIAGAGFDVFWNETADPNDKLSKLDSIVLTPHIAGWITESAESTARIIVTNIERISRGEIY